MKIKLGNRVQDIVTGLEGIATARCEYLNGCVQLMVKPPIDDKGKMREGEWIDSQQLRLVNSGILDHGNVSDLGATGGPAPEAAPKQYIG